MPVVYRCGNRDQCRYVGLYLAERNVGWPGHTHSTQITSHTSSYICVDCLLARFVKERIGVSRVGLAPISVRYKEGYVV